MINKESFSEGDIVILSHTSISTDEDKEGNFRVRNPKTITSMDFKSFENQKLKTPDNKFKNKFNKF